MSIQNLKQPSFKSERRFIFFRATLKQEHRAYRQSQKQAKANSLHSLFQFCLCEVLTPSFTNDDSLRKMLYLASQKIVERWTQRCRNWDVVLSQLSIIFEDRIPA